jgi:hypothetical protein
MHWRLTAQQPLEGTRTDFTFTRIDGPTQKVTVYIDGHRFHATREHNRLATDAAARTRLRADGDVVFQITWADLDLFEDVRARAEPVWPPYPGSAQEGAKTAYEQYGGNRAHFADAVFTNPIHTLLAYLRNPDPGRWSRRARALVTGLTAAPGTTQAISTDRRSDLVRALRQALADCAPSFGTIPASGTTDGAGVGPVHVFRATDDQGLSLVFTIDASDPEALRWSALAVLDDADTVLETEEHKRRWRAWLYWSNLLQFLSRDGGDGVQLAASGTAGFPVEMLAVCGGVGELESLRGELAPPASRAEAASVLVSPVAASDEGSSAEAQLVRMLRDPAWDEDILPILTEDNEEPDLTALATAIADRGKLAPVFGYELGASRWPADLAWDESGVKVAVVPVHRSDDDPEAERRDDAYTTAGWTVRTAADWLGRLDSLIALLPDAPLDTEGSLR